MGAADWTGRLKRARFSAALILTLLCPNAWVMSTDDAAHDATLAKTLAMDKAQERKFWPGGGLGDARGGSLGAGLVLTFRARACDQPENGDGDE